MANDFLGVGWRFPVNVNGSSGAIAMSSHEQDIEQAIRILLFTVKGERVMRPDFGCGIHDYVFASLNTATIGLMESSVRDALARWESRIAVTKVAVSQDPVEISFGKLLIDIQYVVRATNQPGNLVYPFYLREG
ncbi:GPW/gp25 family protein [Paenibacillus sp. MWE-103]|uniref:GPW/gp25 family protein n=1 Tax=Paenibacillus artemisiicola TaxID=1172618 RepID=A0ABS3W5I8_9BACL|nr:GPW/gp25 family protein [Paenibacillus artemisiicola]MBO7743577.1 GPW/gp25 family protein [Paenibacillus artemisiicola]